MCNYPSNVSDSQWQVIKKYLAPERKRAHDLREILNGILYLVKTGCQWRYLPSDFPKWQTVFYYFNSWKHRGVFQKIQLGMVRQVRVLEGREAEPTAAIIDSQSVKATLVSTGGHTGFDAGKKIKGVKRHIATDTLGLMLCVVVHHAGIQDRDGALLVLKKLQRYWHKIIKVFADGGYRGKLVEKALGLFGYVIDIVKRNEQHVFKILPKRWLVERAFSWIDTNRRTAKSYERRLCTIEAVTQIAAIRIMLKRF
jgi:putative transposase